MFIPLNSRFSIFNSHCVCTHMAIISFIFNPFYDFFLKMGFFLKNQQDNNIIDKRNNLAYQFVFLTFCTLCASAILFKAWVCDDAYITFRVIDNFIHGYGLRWNIDERVQVYSHPLWMLLHIPFYALFGNIFLITIILSAIFSLTALILIAKSFNRSRFIISVVLFFPLLASESFSDYTTSGLENPLSFFLFALFGWCLIRKKSSLPTLVFIASLATLTRYDTILLYLPLLSYKLYSERKNLPWLKLLLAVLPLILWLIFSLFYYGFLFPNTYYAKLNTGISIFNYCIQGLRYCYDLLINDTFSFAILITGIVITLCTAFKMLKLSSPLSHYVITLGCGIIAYILYILYIGGDFMAGRFFALPVLTSLWLIYATIPSWQKHLRYAWIFLLPIFLYLGTLSEGRVASYIGDQRALYAIQYSLFNPVYTSLRTNLSDHHYLQEHENFLHLYPQADGIIIRGAVGIYGYYAGPHVIIIDNYALTDALLARLPWKPRSEKYIGLPIGHFPRGKPKGYIESRVYGTFSEMEPEIAEYYAHLKEITSGNLWSFERLKTIMLFNVDFYDSALKTYIEKNYPSAPESPLEKGYLILKNHS